MNRGAEAIVEIKENEIIKRRERKSYRSPELDKRIISERTSTEAKLLQEAEKFGVNVPETEQIENNVLSQEKIDGYKISDNIEDKITLMKDLGENIAILHSNDIIHGDLTTSNVLVEKDTDKLYLIDFGLSFRSKRLEDKAVDLHLLKQVLESSHPEINEEGWESFLEGYSNYQNCSDVLSQLEDVESRGRYK